MARSKTSYPEKKKPKPDEEKRSHPAGKQPEGGSPKPEPEPDPYPAYPERPRGSGGKPYPERPGGKPEPDPPGGKPDPERPGGQVREPRPARPRIDPANTRPATPYLVIRSFDSDLGLRPLAPSEAGPAAFSPDIPIVPESTPEGSLILSCWVTNIGFGPAAPIQIEFFLMPPSITQPAAAPFLVATEYAVVEPHSSRLIRSRPLTFPNPFGGGLAEGVMVRVSTPFDRAGPDLDPLVDRHVAMMNAWPITDSQPSVDFGISNWLETPTSAHIDVTIDHVRLALRHEDQPAVRRRFALNDLLTVDLPEPDVSRQLDRLSRQRRVSPQIARRLRRSLAGPPVDRKKHAQRRGQNTQLALEITPLETRRRLFPDDTLQPRACLPMRPGSALNLSPGRRPLVEGMELAPLEERQIRLSIGPRPPVRPDEFVIVHLHHIGPNRDTLLGRLSLILAPETGL